MQKKQNIDTEIYIEQESVSKIFLRNINNADVWYNLFFSNVFQLLPIWIMVLIQLVSKYRFDIQNYISNLLVFVIVSCVTVLCDLFGKTSFKMDELSTTVIIFVLISLSCVASVLYCLVLLYDVTELVIKEHTILYCSFIFTFITILMSLWKAARKEK